MSPKEAPPGENQRLNPLDKSILPTARLPSCTLVAGSLDLVPGDRFLKDSRQVLPGRVQVVGRQTPTQLVRVQQTSTRAKFP